MSRVYNFSAGPSMLAESVLKTAADEMLDYHGCGQSVMEMSHRSKIYKTIIEGAEALLREVMNIPDNYKVLFLQGGASTQFAAAGRGWPHLPPAWGSAGTEAAPCGRPAARRTPRRA